MKIRPMQDGDTNFILSTWLKSYYDALKYYAHNGAPYPRDDVFFQGHQNRIKEKLKSAQVLICVAPDDDNQIIGWLCFDDKSFHYCYVKQVFRKMGVAKKLKESAFVNQKSYSHHTKYSRYLNTGIIYDPYRF